MTKTAGYTAASSLPRPYCNCACAVPHRCTYAPPAEDVHRYELVGEAGAKLARHLSPEADLKIIPLTCLSLDTGKKNGCKILRSQLWRRPEWSNVEMRREAVRIANTSANPASRVVRVLLTLTGLHLLG